MNGKEKSSSLVSRVAKVLKPHQPWENKEEFLDAIYWTKQCLSIVIGVVWGVIPLHGFLGMLAFFAANIGLIYLYHSFYQRVDAEEYGGAYEIMKEGMMGAFAIFLVSWILTYSSLHF